MWEIKIKLSVKFGDKFIKDIYWVVGIVVVCFVFVGYGFFLIVFLVSGLFYVVEKNFIIIFVFCLMVIVVIFVLVVLFLLLIEEFRIVYVV